MCIFKQLLSPLECQVTALLKMSGQLQWRLHLIKLTVLLLLLMFVHKISLLWVSLLLALSAVKCVIAVGLDYGVRGRFSPLEFGVNVPAGRTSAPFSVNIINDNILEQVESFRLNMIGLSAGGFCGATIARASTEVNITDDDG